MNYANKLSHLLKFQKQIIKQNRKIITFTKHYSLASPQLKPNGQRQPSDLIRIQYFTNSRKMFMDDFINQTQNRKSLTRSKQSHMTGNNTRRNRIVTQSNYIARKIYNIYVRKRTKAK